MDFVVTMMPTTAWDALIYHYTMPMKWLEAGGFVSVPGVIYSELPSATEMLFASAFGMGGIGPDRAGAGVLAANHLAWAAGALVIATVISIGRHLGDCESPRPQGKVWDSTTPGLIAALAYLSLPITHIELMQGGFIDNFLAFLSLALVAGLLEYKDNASPRILLLLGVFGGGILATKHSGFTLDMFAFIALIVWTFRKPLESRAWGFLWTAAAIALLIPAPWYLKSYINTLNPIYPFAEHIIRPLDPAPDIMYWANPNIHRSIVGFLTWIPRLTWDESIVQLKGRMLSWYFLAFFPFSIWFGIVQKRARVAALVAGIHIAVVYLYAPGEPRYALMALFLYAIIGAWGALTAFRFSPRFVMFAIPILLALPITGSLIMRTVELNRRIPVILGIGSMDSYYEKEHDIQLMNRFINTETPPDSTVIMVDPRVFQINRPWIIWYPFPSEPTYGWVHEPLRLLRRWKDANVGYVFVSFGANYRAISIYEALRNSGPNAPDEFSLFPNLPEWVFKRACFAEEGMSLNRLGKPVMSPEVLDRRLKDFDVKSIAKLYDLYRHGILTPVYVDPRAGTIFKVNYPSEFPFI
jgi:hypothetical protein